MFRFEKLDIWQLAIEYADEIYDLTKRLPKEKKHNFIDQLKRAAVSISNNIAEGSGTATKKKFCSFLDISVASTLETVNLLHFAKKRDYIAEEERTKFYNKAELLVKKITSFKGSLK